MKVILLPVLYPFALFIRYLVFSCVPLVFQGPPLLSSPVQISLKAEALMLPLVFLDTTDIPAPRTVLGGPQQVLDKC